MTDPTITVASSPAVQTAAAASPPAGQADSAKIRDLAAQFESLLLSQMMRDLKSAMVDDGKTEDGYDTSPLGDQVTSELSLALSRAGGFGLGSALSSAIARQAGTASGDPSALSAVTIDLPPSLPVMPGRIGGGDVPDAMSLSDAVLGAVLPSPAAPPATPAAATLPAVVTPPVVAAPAVAPTPAPTTHATISSGFGWRNDPIAGDRRFHKGLDVAMAAGQPVRSAIDGTVVSVGQQTGYGLTVVVANAQGLETKYAHLSGADVQAGSTVSRGDLIAQSGNSGRSTGPHLHFEVLSKGQAVDPGPWLGAVLNVPEGQ